MSSRVFLKVGYFVLCLYCICCSVDVSFRVTFCYDSLGVWYFFGRWYRCCVFALYRVEVCINDVFIVLMLITCVIYC